MRLSELLDRPIAFQRTFVSLGVGITGALMLSQAVYWSNRITDESGWFYKTQAEWEDETGLTRREQEGARARLRTLHILEEEARGIPAKLYYRVDFDVLEKLMHETAKQGCTRRVKACTKAPNSDGENVQAVEAESAKQLSAKRAGSAGEKRQTKLRQTTTETTTETTSDISTAGADTPAGQEGGLPAGIAMQVTTASGVYDVPAELRYPKPGSPTHKTWMAYAIAYLHRHGTWPKWNATMGGLVAQAIQRLGEEDAPRVAAYYVRRVNEQGVVRKMHSFKLLLADAETYHTQWLSGRTMTATQAQQADKTEANASIVDGATAKALAIIEARRREREEEGGEGGAAC